MVSGLFSSLSFFDFEFFFFLLEVVIHLIDIKLIYMYLGKMFRRTDDTYLYRKKKTLVRGREVISKKCDGVRQIMSVQEQVNNLRIKICIL